MTDLTAYGAYGDDIRVPASVELSCADPHSPCSLPNAFTSHPALKAVMSHNAEIGGRGRLGGDMQWNVAILRTDLRDDIQGDPPPGIARNTLELPAAARSVRRLRWAPASRCNRIDMAQRTVSRRRGAARNLDRTELAIWQPTW
jgi:hypothetical protein